MASPSLSNSTKATKTIREIREEEQSRTTPNSPRGMFSLCFIFFDYSRNQII
jgi:hypothetical protein